MFLLLRSRFPHSGRPLVALPGERAQSRAADRRRVLTLNLMLQGLHKEAGRTHELAQDLEYNIDGLRASQSLAVRRRSALELARMLKNKETRLVTLVAALLLGGAPTQPQREEGALTRAVCRSCGRRN